MSCPGWNRRALALVFALTTAACSTGAADQYADFAPEEVEWLRQRQQEAGAVGDAGTDLLHSGLLFNAECRELFNVFQAVAAGQPVPAATELPERLASSEIASHYTFLLDGARSGDPTELSSFLFDAAGGCGSVPRDPRTPNGPTIADAGG